VAWWWPVNTSKHAAYILQINVCCADVYQWLYCILRQSTSWCPLKKIAILLQDLEYDPCYIAHRNNFPIPSLNGEEEPHTGVPSRGSNLQSTYLTCLLRHRTPLVAEQRLPHCKSWLLITVGISSVSENTKWLHCKKYDIRLTTLNLTEVIPLCGNRFA
jgi:hypothetical protein